MLRSFALGVTRLRFLFRRYLAGHEEADQTDQDHRDTVSMKEEVPWLAQRDDPDNH
jgi:hypothetical protein